MWSGAQQGEDAVMEETVPRHTVEQRGTKAQSLAETAVKVS